MLLYEGSIEIDVPVGYTDISRLLGVHSYQRTFAKQGNKDDFVIIDVMHPVEQADMHIEDILRMNEIFTPSIQEIEYTSREFRKSIHMYMKKHKCTQKPIQRNKKEQEYEWIYTRLSGEVTKNDGEIKSVEIVIGITKYVLCDIVISVFKEETYTEQEIEDIKNMIKTIRVINHNAFIQQ